MKVTFKTLLIIGVAILLLVSTYFMPSASESVISEIQERDTVSETGFKIIAFGDSLTAGYGLPIDESYPSQLEAKLQERGFSVTVINSGVSGETTRGNLERAPFVGKQNPDVVLLGIGGNDALRSLPIEETRKNIQKTINILKDNENPPVIILLTMQAPLNAGLGYKKLFDSMFEELATKNELVLVPFITTEVFLDSELKLSDGIHFNQKGYAKIIDLYLLDTMIEILEKMKKE